MTRSADLHMRYGCLCTCGIPESLVQNSQTVVVMVCNLSISQASGGDLDEVEGLDSIILNGYGILSACAVVDDTEGSGRRSNARVSQDLMVEPNARGGRHVPEVPPYLDRGEK